MTQVKKHNYAQMSQDENGNSVDFKIPLKDLMQERHFKDKCFYNTSERTLNKLTAIHYKATDIREQLLITNNDRIDFKSQMRNSVTK